MSLSIVIPVFLIGCAVIVYCLNKISRLEEQIRNLRSSQQYENLADHPVNDELRRLVEENQEVKAIKKAREAFGMSLLEAKKYVDNL
ncbi:hypothetical protein [Planomicrobium okeanokoites]|uniref:hypothetical protein n=1 Tax=Planomicrobium okeanokoites TaxID=244 RepID=UPI00249192E4|nr:hypothetical protein [Planomicrobium okeanokoites]